MEKKKSLLYYIKSDLERLQSTNSSRKAFFLFMKWYFLPKGSTFPHDVWFRISSYCKKVSVLKYTIGILAYIVERHYAHKYGVYANTNIRVGEGLKVVHGSGVYLNCKRIGDNFTVYQGVTLGSSGDGYNIPVVEDNVTVYAGAIVVGNVTLGKGCVVAANSFVNRDVPEYTVVGGNPAREIKRVENH